MSKFVEFFKNIPVKFEAWVAKKPKWVQMSIGTNLGRMGIATFLFIFFFWLHDIVFYASADLSDILYYISLPFLAYIVIFILLMCSWAVKNLIKDTKEMIKNKKK